MTYIYDEERKKLKISFDEDIDINSCRTLRSIVDGYIIRYSPSICELNMEKVGFMDSSGLGFVMGRYNLANMLNCKLLITNASSNINKILHIYEKSKNTKVV